LSEQELQQYVSIAGWVESYYGTDTLQFFPKQNLRNSIFETVFFFKIIAIILSLPVFHNCSNKDITMVSRRLVVGHYLLDQKAGGWPLSLRSEGWWLVTIS